MGKFGDKFRKERERQNVKLEDVSTSTKISTRMLRAIEEERFDQLPGGVFNKGFVRAYAKHLGLDEEDAVAGYLATLNDQSGNRLDAESSLPERRAPNSGERWHGKERRDSDRRDHDQKNERRYKDRRHSEPDELPELQLPKAEHIRPRRKMAVYSESSGVPRTLAAVAAIIVAAGALWWSYSRSARANASNSPPAVAASSAAITAPSSAPPAPGNTGASERTAAPLAASLHATAKPGPRLVSSSSATGSATGNSSPIAGNPAVAKTGEVDTEEAPPVAPEHRPSNLTLVIHAAENSWISVTADGQPILHETLIAPAETSIRAARQITVRAGNAGGVTFSLNGQDIPAQGAEGEVKILVFESTGVRVVTPSTPPASPAASATSPAGPIP